MKCLWWSLLLSAALRWRFIDRLVDSFALRQSASVARQTFLSGPRQQTGKALEYDQRSVFACEPYRLLGIGAVDNKQQQANSRFLQTPVAVSPVLVLPLPRLP